MANKVHFSSSNDRLVVEAGGVIEINGGEIQGQFPPRLLPPPVGTADGSVLTAKGSAPGGADWEAGGFEPTITAPQQGDQLIRDGAAWVNLPLSTYEVLLDNDGNPLTDNDGGVMLAPRQRDDDRLAALADVLYTTALQDGDILAWDAALGKFRNRRAP